MADIVSYSTIWGNSSSTTKETTFTNGIDSNILNVSAKDSRNWVGSISYDITENYINYIKLGFKKFTLERPETTSNAINANINGVWFNGSFGVSTNTLELKFRYKEKDGSYGEYQTITLTIENNTFSYSGSIGDAYDYQKQYDFEFVLTDKLMSVIATFNVEKGESIIRVAETYVLIRGDLNVEGNLNINGNANIDGNFTINNMPIMEIIKNNNGTYIKYENGLLVQYGIIIAPSNQTYADLNFPTAFSNSDILDIRIQAGIRYVGGSDTGGSAQLTTLTTPQIQNVSGGYVYNVKTDGTAPNFQRYLEWLAIGNWK